MKLFGRVLIVLLISLFSIGTGPINAHADDISVIEPTDQNRLVVFEAFMRPA